MCNHSCSKMLRCKIAGFLSMNTFSFLLQFYIVTRIYCRMLQVIGAGSWLVKTLRFYHFERMICCKAHVGNKKNSKKASNSALCKKCNDVSANLLSGTQWVHFPGTSGFSTVFLKILSPIAPIETFFVGSRHVINGQINKLQTKLRISCSSADTFVKTVSWYYLYLSNDPYSFFYTWITPHYMSYVWK